MANEEEMASHESVRKEAHAMERGTMASVGVECSTAMVGWISKSVGKKGGRRGVEDNDIDHERRKTRVAEQKSLKVQIMAIESFSFLYFLSP